MYRFFSLFCSIVLIVSLAACSQDKPKDAASVPQSSEQPDIGIATAPATPVTGKVLETMDAAGYTYLNVETAEGERWVAVNQSTVMVGDEVTFMDGMVRTAYQAKYVAYYSYYGRMEVVPGAEGIRDTSLVEVGFGIPDFASIGDDVWQITMASWPEVEGNRQVKAILWVHPGTAKVYYVLSPNHCDNEVFQGQVTDALESQGSSGG